MTQLYWNKSIFWSEKCLNTYSYYCITIWKFQVLVSMEVISQPLVNVGIISVMIAIDNKQLTIIGNCKMVWHSTIYCYIKLSNDYVGTWRAISLGQIWCWLKFTSHKLPTISVTSKNLPNVYKSCPKMIALDKWNILTPLQILPKNMG